MDVGSLLSPIERAFTDPTVERLAFLLAVVVSILLLNRSTGFTHHYDLSQQIEEFKEMRTTTTSDSGATAKMDSVRTSIVSQMKEWQTSPTPSQERRVRILTTLPLGLLILAVALVEAYQKPAASFKTIKGVATVGIYAFIMPFLSVITVEPQGSIPAAVGMTIISQIGVICTFAVFVLFVGPSIRATMRWIAESVFGLETDRDPQIDGIQDTDNQEET